MNSTRGRLGVRKYADIVREYWSRSELGRRMINSNSVTESDLLFLIPNNKKRMLGLPLTRCAQRSRKKKEYKQNRRKTIYSFSLFDILEETIEDVLTRDIKNGSFFQQFVDFKNVSLGDKNLFVQEPIGGNYESYYKFKQRISIQDTNFFERKSGLLSLQNNKNPRH